MATYCTIENITSAMTESVVAQLSNDSTPSEVDEDVVNALIADASDLIDSFLRGRYSLPLSKSHTIIENICVDLVRYELYRRRGQTHEDIRSFHAHAHALLTKIQRGEIKLDEGDADERPRRYYTNTKTSVMTNIENYLD